MRGRYPDYDVLDEADHWDEVTRRLVLDRVENVPPIRFFTRRGGSRARRLLRSVLAQDGEPKIPVLNMVDAKLFAGELDGFRYADMPDDPRDLAPRRARASTRPPCSTASIEFADAARESRSTSSRRSPRASCTVEVWDELPASARLEGGDARDR